VIETSASIESSVLPIIKTCIDGMNKASESINVQEVWTTFLSFTLLNYTGCSSLVLNLDLLYSLYCNTILINSFLESFNFEIISKASHSVNQPEVFV
jgi:hypothetical protein